MTLKTIAGVAVSILLFQNVTQAQVRAPKYSNEFMALGVGARSLALGNASVAIVQDATSGYWNPAGMLHSKTQYSATLMHSELFAGIAKHDYGSFSMRLDSSSAIGVSVIRLGVDDIANTLNLFNSDGVLDYNNISYFSVADYGGLVSYARKSNLIKGLTLGANGKLIYRTVGSFANAWGFGIDAGAQLQRGNWQFGLMARDITTTFNAWSYNKDQLVFKDSLNAVPDNNIELTVPKIIPGVAYKYAFTENFGAMATMDVDLTFDGKRNVLIGSKILSADPHAGLEVNYKNLIFLRGGVNNYQEIKKVEGGTAKSVRLSSGVGIATNGLVLDLALVRAAEGTTLNSYIISLGYNFNK